MASTEVPQNLSRSETFGKKHAFRHYARLEFGKRSEDESIAPYRDVIEEENKRISKVRNRFRGDKSKLELLRNVARSREALIPHLSERAKNRDPQPPHVSSVPQEECNCNECNCNTCYCNARQADASLETLVGGKEPVEEFKAGVMYFEKESDGKWRGTQCMDVGVDSSSGEFPNQKMKIDVLLSDANSPNLFKSDGEKIKYFHFPANHMGWIESALEKYHEANNEDKREDEQEGEEVYFKSPLLSREYWRGQLAGAGIRHMRPRCAHVSDDTSYNTPANIALFLPYLHWETNRRRAKMAEIVQEAVNGNKVPLRSKMYEAAEKRAPCLRPKFSHKVIRNKVARYLYDIAQVWDAMDCEADERLLRQSLSKTKQNSFTTGSKNPEEVPPLHIRRTLDQSYFSAVEDTTVRDMDQVVYRQTRARRQQHREVNGGNDTPRDSQFGGSSDTAVDPTKMVKLVGVTRVVMVDQLWMWILGDNTIITSFPRRWGRNKPDSSGVHKSLRQILGKRKSIRSVYHLALLIIDQCSKVFFDRTQPTDDRPEVMDLFAEAIGTVSYHTSSAYSVFWQNFNLHSPSMARFQNRDSDPSKYLNINPEGVLLKESQDIIEELKIMEGHYKHQLAVVGELRKHMKSRHDRDQSPDASHSIWPKKPKKEIISREDLEEGDYLIEKIQNRCAEISDLHMAVTNTNDQLRALLSLKQQEASIVEARTALKQGEESVKQGEESVKQGEESVKQGRAIMAFTIVTIFFVPLSFFTGFFGMNNGKSTGDEWMTMGEQIMYMFVISIVISTIVLVVAFRMGSTLPSGLKLWRSKKVKKETSEV